MSAEELPDLCSYERAAAARLSEPALNYYRSGADAERTLAANEAAWQELRLHPRVLVDVSRRDLEVDVLGHRLAFPVAVAPMACQGLAHPDGEVATVRAASAAGTLMIMSTVSNRAVEDVTAAASGPVWFQLYVSRERSETRDLVARVEAAGCAALVITADTPVIGRRPSNLHGGFRLPPDLEFPHLRADPTGLREEPAKGQNALADFAARTLDPSLAWKDVEELASRTRLPVLVKGVLRPDDAKRAFAHGVSGVIVSNHGGRQLDTVPATAEVLEPIVEAVGDSGDVLVDGGIRRGTDVLKALALGARAVLLGRPLLWGLAVAGEAGARHVLELIRDELDRALALAGCTNARTVPRDLTD